MGRTKAKLRNGEPALGGWITIGHPAIAELMAGEGFDWIAVDLEHTTTDVRTFYEMALAVQGTGCDLLARLHSCDPVLAKVVLDAGAQGVIIPSVNTPEQAAQAASMTRFPPGGTRGVSLCRATDYGRNFADYFARHNDEVIVVVMLEHIDAVGQADAILATPGIDAAFIGPYDLSASMGLVGQLDHPEVLAAQKSVLDACVRHHVAPGIHVVSVDGEELSRRIAAGFRFPRLRHRWPLHPARLPPNPEQLPAACVRIATSPTRRDRGRVPPDHAGPVARTGIYCIDNIC